MGLCLGYHFDEVYIKKTIYFPLAHLNDENDQRAVRDFLLKILKGEQRFKMETTLVPADDAGAAFALRYQADILGVLEGDKLIRFASAQTQPPATHHQLQAHRTRDPLPRLLALSLAVFQSFFGTSEGGTGLRTSRI